MKRAKKKGGHPIDVAFEISFLSTEVDKKILTRMGAPKKLVSGIWYNGICFDPDGICWQVTKSLFPPGIIDIGNMKPAHQRQDDPPFPDLIQAASFGRTEAMFLMVEHNPLAGLYPPDDLGGRERRKSVKAVEALRAWESIRDALTPRRA